MNCKSYDYWRYEGEIREDIRESIISIKDKCPREILNHLKFEGEGIFYRFEIDETDTYPYFKSNPDLFKERSRNRKSVCMMCELSVFRSLEETKEALLKVLNSKRRKVPNRFITPKVVICRNLSKHGEVYNTPSVGSPHYTFFPCEGYDPERVWTVLEELV